MQFKIGAVYRNKVSGVDFIACQQHHDEAGNVLTFHLINVNNWIVLETTTGKMLINGEVSCARLSPDDYDCVSPSLPDYYAPKKKRSAKPVGEAV